MASVCCYVTITFLQTRVVGKTNGTTTDFSYDYNYNGLDWVTSETSVQPSLVTSVLTPTYDLAGRRTALKATFNSALDFHNTYGYDAMNRLTSIKQQSQAGGNAVAEKYVKFAFRADSQFDTITRYANVAGTQTVATTTFGYDTASGANTASRLASIKHTAGCRGRLAIEVATAIPARFHQRHWLIGPPFALRLLLLRYTRRMNHRCGDSSTRQIEREKIVFGEGKA